MRRPRWYRSSLIVAALTLGVASVPGAPSSAKADPLGVIAGETLDVTADKLDVDIERGRALLQGEVTVVMGELRVECPKVEIGYDEAPKVRWARGSGGVQMSIKGIDAKAQLVEVDVAKRRVRLKGGVRLTRGKGWITAERASIDIPTQKVTLHDVKGSIPVDRPKR